MTGNQQSVQQSPSKPGEPTTQLYPLTADSPVPVTPNPVMPGSGTVKFRGEAVDPSRYLTAVDVNVNGQATRKDMANAQGTWDIVAGRVVCNASNSWEATSWWYGSTTIPQPSKSGPITFTAAPCSGGPMPPPIPPTPPMIAPMAASSAPPASPTGSAPMSGSGPARSLVTALEPITVGPWLLYGDISADLPWSTGALLFNGGQPLVAQKIAVFATGVSWRIQGLAELEMNRPLGRLVAAGRGYPSPWRFPGAPEGCLFITQTSCFHSPSVDHVVAATNECDADVISITARHPLIYVNLNALPVHPLRPNTGSFSLWIRILQ